MALTPALPIGVGFKELPNTCSNLVPNLPEHRDSAILVACRVGRIPEWPVHQPLCAREDRTGDFRAVAHGDNEVELLAAELGD